MPTTDPGELTRWLSRLLSAVLGTPAEVVELERQPGGASKDTWTFRARDAAGGDRALVLRSDRSGGAALSMTTEAALLSAAHDAGVPVPGVVAAGVEDGRGYLIVDFVEGETIPRRILRDAALADTRAHLAKQCGEILAALHRMPADEIPGLPASRDTVGDLRRTLEQLGQPHPAFELALLWLDRHRPPTRPAVVVHGDFRNGNLIIGPEGVRAVLDWELAHVGDPVEDLGWLCVRAWRFGSPLPVGGFGELDELLGGYRGAGAGDVDEATLQWWILFGTVRWGVICIAQVLTHTSGLVRSVELAAIGRRVCEVESDVLELLPWGTPQLPNPSASPSDHEHAPPSAPHDVPSGPALLEAVREFLERDVVTQTEGRLRFHARVAANVVAMVGREIPTSSAMSAAHAARLSSLGTASDAELAQAIRTGAFDDRLDVVTDAVRASVADKLAVANPRYRSS